MGWSFTDVEKTARRGGREPELVRKQQEMLRGRWIYELSLGEEYELEIAIVSCQNLHLISRKETESPWKNDCR